MNDLFRKSALPVMLLASTVLFSGCATQGKPPPTISLDEPVQGPAAAGATKTGGGGSRCRQPLALPSQLKPLPETEEAKPAPEPADEKVRVSRANAEARVAPTREGYVNAIQGLALYRWRALPALRGRGPRDGGFAAARRGTGDGRGRRPRCAGSSGTRRAAAVRLCAST